MQVALGIVSNTELNFHEEFSLTDMLIFIVLYRTIIYVLNARYLKTLECCKIAV